jgi:hypothetical protein
MVGKMSGTLSTILPVFHAMLKLDEFHSYESLIIPAIDPIMDIHYV